MPQTEGKPGAGSARRPLRVALGSGVTFLVGSSLCHGEGETWKERAHEELKNPAKGREKSQPLGREIPCFVCVVKTPV